MALRGSNYCVSNSLSYISNKNHVKRTTCNKTGLANTQIDVSENHKQTAGAIIDLLYIRDNMSNTEFTSEEVNFLLQYLCTELP